MKTDIGTVYLIHFDRPYKHACHYIGFTTNLERRFKDHSTCNGSSLLRAVKKAGISFFVARIWEGKSFEFEQQLKRKKKSKTFCPICNPEKYLNYF